MCGWVFREREAYVKRLPKELETKEKGPQVQLDKKRFTKGVSGLLLGSCDRAATARPSRQTCFYSPSVWDSVLGAAQEENVRD